MYTIQLSGTVTGLSGDHLNWYDNINYSSGTCSLNFCSKVLFAGFPSATVAQNITSSDLRNGSVCPGMVFFICETRGSFAIAWTSDEYIGSGNTQLIFAAGASVVGETRRSGGINGTVANLTHNAVENGVTVLVSTLTITVAQNSPGGSVTCMHVGDGTTDTVDFEVIGKIKIIIFNFNNNHALLQLLLVYHRMCLLYR